MKPASAPAELARVSREGIEPLRPSTTTFKATWFTIRLVDHDSKVRLVSATGRTRTFTPQGPRSQRGASCQLRHSREGSEEHGAGSAEYAAPIPTPCPMLPAPCSNCPRKDSNFHVPRSERGDSANWSTWAVAPRIGYDPILSARQAGVHSQYTNAAK
jgi:hypothetical protein